MRVLLGPAHELHAGAHGSLRDAPPATVEYVSDMYSVRFLHPPRRTSPFSPLHDIAREEWVYFDHTIDRDIIHSSRLPVESECGWVVDADSLLSTLRAGTFLALGSADALRAGAIPEMDRLARARAMLRLYCSPRCARVIFWTERGRQELLAYVRSRGLAGSAALDHLEEKSHVVYPAVPAKAPQASPNGTVKILYTGRTFADKGGVVAAAVFCQLAEMRTTECQLSFVGPCPRALVGRLEASGVDVQHWLPRERYLKLLAETDVFFSPTSFESFGMALVEAIATGAAIVCSSGPGMEHIAELLVSGENALLISNELTLRARVAAFVEALDALIVNADLRRHLGHCNRRLTTHGRLSQTRRDEGLLAAYDAAMCVKVRKREDAGQTEKYELFEWRAETCHWETRRLACELGGRILL